MNQLELCELMTVHGFYQFLAQEARLTTEEVQRIYLLGRPWGVWPAGIDVSREAAEIGIDVFTYLAALQPLITMDAQEKEAELGAYERALARGETAKLPSASRQHVEKVAALAAANEQTICNVFHALYGYRQRVGALSIKKMIENKNAAITNLQRGLEAEIRRRDGNDHGPSAHSSPA